MDQERSDRDGDELAAETAQAVAADAIRRAKTSETYPFVVLRAGCPIPWIVQTEGLVDPWSG